MKALIFILILSALAAAYLYWRMRPYIKVARQIFGSARDMRRVDVRDEPSAAGVQRGGERAAGEMLVHCASCGMWVPVSRAIRPGKSGEGYCSHACLERAAENPDRTRKSAS